MSTHCSTNAELSKHPDGFLWQWLVIIAKDGGAIIIGNESVIFFVVIAKRHYLDQDGIEDPAMMFSTWPKWLMGSLGC
jgi:hypothetical protein